MQITSQLFISETIYFSLKVYLIAPGHVVISDIRNIMNFYRTNSPFIKFCLLKYYLVHNGAATIYKIKCNINFHFHRPLWEMILIHG